MNRLQTKQIKVGNLTIGGQNKCIIQSMTNTKTKNISATVEQIKQLENAGCELVRVAILDAEDAKAIKQIKTKINIPIVGDIHFNHKLAIIAIENGIDKIRLNPGNLTNKQHIIDVVNKCKEYHVPIRIGINTGSLNKDILRKYGKPCAEAMIESAQEHIKILEDLDFTDICLSFKSSDVQLCIEAYRLAAKTFNYPLHLGVTEAGTFFKATVKSAAALGTLLADQIGDTIRISISANPVEEIKVCKELLRCFKLINNVPNLISCPTCGRIQYDMLPIAQEIENYLQTKSSNIEVAIMGCPVNGPQEASRADIGIAGAKDSAILFKKGQIIRTIKQEDIIEELKKEIDLFIENEII